MAKQKQINLQVLLLLTGVFFTALSAAKACFVPYVSIYLRQLGLSAMQVGVILGCQGLLVACTASCIGRFLIRFRYARLFLLLAIVLYLGGVLGFTLIPTSSTALFQVYCVGFSNNTNNTASSGVSNAVVLLQQNDSHREVVSTVATKVPSPMSPENPVTTAKVKNLPEVQDISLKTTTHLAPVIENLPGTVATVEKIQDTLTESKDSLVQTVNTMDEVHVDPESVAEPQYENMQSHKAEEFDTQDFDSQASSPTAGSFPRSRHRPGNNNRQYPKMEGDPYVPRKRYRGQQLHNDQNPGRYMGESLDPLPDWNWQTESQTDFDTERYPAWDRDQDHQGLQDNKDDHDGYNEDVLDWLLRNGAGRTSSHGQQYLRNRVKRSDIIANETTSITPSKEEDATGPSTAVTTKEIDDATSNGISSTFWLALLVVVITGTFAGPIEHMCDTALYHQLDNIDELDKYKRPSLLTMPVFAAMALVSALVVDSTACFLYGNASHMAIHFYLSAAFIGVVFLVGIIVPLSHKIKNQQEGKYIKSIKFLYSDGHTAVMCVTLVVTAMISSCSDGFLFWLIQDLHGLETTMGVSLAVAFMTELPMSMIFTPWLVQKLGNVWLLALGTACLGLQNLYYSVLWTPWAVVPIQLLHALGRSAIRGCILAFLNEASPPGMGKAIQVTVLALEQGVGMALGSILWGVLYGILTVKLIFVAAAIMALVWTVVLIICACRLPTKKRFMYAKLLQSDMEMDMKGGAFGSDSEDNEEKQWLHDAIRDEDDGE
ncbi:major facilitator superfamily domain-containing protein 6-like protein B [Strongylocentrotus purpuratus]|uniref:Major facilitator superfamily associated domain-containing protein n=1 Tax=Strongylocentrotus purpuratus TaxID=7668 RepID=A0A7M7NT04_STRPU|nr:major facilitator superfamily domain-containing protein 6-like protein B [Strongylocentrotus purpuratus]